MLGNQLEGFEVADFEFEGSRESWHIRLVQRVNMPGLGQCRNLGAFLWRRTTVKRFP